MAIPAPPFDPYATPVAAWDGPWPPDPSWDDPTIAVPPILPPPAESPVPDGALEAPLPAQPIDPYAAPPPAPGDGGVQLGFPTNPDAAGFAPIDESLIEMNPDEADWSGLDAGAAPVDPYADVGQPWDAELIEQEEPAAEPFAPTDAEREARLGELLPQLSDEDLALRQYQRDRAAEDEAIAARTVAAAADRKAAEDNERVYRTATQRARQQADAIAAESDRLAAERVDPDGWRESRTLFQTIAMYTAGIVGGLLQSRNGGPNQGLAMINDAIEKHIDAQKANLAHRRDMLGRKEAANSEQMARIGDDFATEESFRQAAWKRAIVDIETEQQQYDPAGTRALKLEGFKRELAGQAAAAQAAAAEKLLDREIKIGEYDLKVATFNEQARKNAAAEQLAARKSAGGGGGVSATKGKFDPMALAQRFGVDPATVSGLPPMTVGEFGQYLEVAKKGRALNEPTDLEKRKSEMAIYVNGEPLEWKEGVPAGKPEDVSKLRQAITYGGLQTDLINEVLAIRDRVGGESSWGNSDDFQRLKVLESALKKYAKAPTEGLSSENDMVMVADSIGANDLSSFRARAAGLKKGRDLTLTEVNAMARAAGLKGPGISYPNKFKKAKLTPDQQKASDLVKSTTGEKGQAVPDWAVASPAGAIVRVTESLVRSENNELGDGDEKAQLDTWAMAANDPKAGDEERRSAMAALVSVGNDSRSPAVRTYAKHLLMFRVKNPPRAAASEDEE